MNSSKTAAAGKENAATDKTLTTYRIAEDDDKEIEVGPGDVMLTGTGHGHALENKSDEELVYAALIYSDKE